MDISVDLELLRGFCRQGFPPLPSAAIRQTLDLAGNDQINNAVLTEQIESDSRISDRFLACSNLPMFCAGRSINTVRQGVEKLGRRKIVSLFWLLALADFLQSWKRLENQARNRLWRHSLLTGVLAKQLALAAELDELGDTLTAGVAHDIGHLLLVHAEPQFGIVGREESDRLPEEGISSAPERDHCRSGASLLVFWRAPAELVSCALNHHNPESSTTAHRPLIVAVRMADLVAEHFDLDRPIEALHLDAAPAWRQLATVEPWSRIRDLHRLAIERLPDSLLTAQHLARVLGGPIAG